MTLEQVKGSTWVLNCWALIPLYKLDDHRCVLLDTGLWDQREEIETILRENGLTVAGVLCSHAHIDHMGCCAYFQSQGAELAMSLGEVGQIFAPLGMQLQYYNFSLCSFREYPELGTAPCLPDRIILPHEDRITFCGAEFEILHTPGHTVDHICVKTPDNVLYLADAMMTGRVLHHSKFPYAFNMETYLDTLGKLRAAKADLFIVAHKGIYDEILPFIDLEITFITRRMQELLDLVEDYTTPKLLTAAMCRHYRARPKSIRSMAYFEQSAQIYIHYLVSTGDLEAVLEEETIRYRKTGKRREALPLPPTGMFR